jgi:hypothetical protein
VLDGPIIALLMILSNPPFSDWVSGARSPGVNQSGSEFDNTYLLPK